MRTIEEIFCNESRGVLSLTGGGGKTSLMFQLARLLVGAGMRVLTTTTTRIFPPTAEQSEKVFIDRDPELIMRLASACIQTARHVTATSMRLADSGKLQGFSPETICTFAESGLFDWIIVEADGAAMRPLKAPEDHEPVIPSCTTIHVAVAGLEAVGAELNEKLVFRSGRAGELMELSAGETITEAALTRLFVNPLGLLKGAPPKARRFIFLNKADDRKRRESGARIAELLRHSLLPEVAGVVVGQALAGVCIHSFHPLGGA